MCGSNAIFPDFDSISDGDISPEDLFCTGINFKKQWAFRLKPLQIIPQIVQYLYFAFGDKLAFSVKTTSNSHKQPTIDRQTRHYVPIIHKYKLFTFIPCLSINIWVKTTNPKIRIKVGEKHRGWY